MTGEALSATLAGMKTDHIGDLKPDLRNARRHNPRNLGMLEDALHEVGAARSVVIDENNVILAGHGVIEAAGNAGIEKVKVIDADGETIIAVRRTGLTAAQKQRLALYDNRVAELADWDAGILADLQAEDAKLLEGLFREDELAELLKGLDKSVAEDPGAQIDRAEELREKWQTASGQLWEIPSQSVQGKAHRLLCGDSTKAEDVARLMGGEKARLLFTDPPYGVKRDKGFEGFGGFGPPIARRQYSDGWDSERPTKETLELALRQAQQAIIFGGNYMADILPVGNHWIVWDKNNTMPTFGDCELCWTNMKRNSVKKYAIEYNGLIGKERERFHPTQKPTALIAAILVDYSTESDLIIDFWSGSGTTMVAAEQTGRICYGCDIEPKYVAVALERMAGMGLEPRLLEPEHTMALQEAII